MREAATALLSRLGRKVTKSGAHSLRTIVEIPWSLHAFKNNGYEVIRISLSRYTVLARKSGKGIADESRVDLKKHFLTMYLVLSTADYNTSKWLNRERIEDLILFNTLLQLSREHVGSYIVSRTNSEQGLSFVEDKIIFITSGYKEASIIIGRGCCWPLVLFTANKDEKFQINSIQHFH